MSGYNCVFPTMFDGTLGGKWPAAAVWCTLLTLKDRNGLVDMSYQAISNRTGWPTELLKQGIEQLMQPDPESRSPVEEGRRLVPIDPSRSWGWKVVNHAIYQDRARKMAQSSQQVADGRNADKVRRYKEGRAAADSALALIASNKTPRDTAGHLKTPADTLSDSDSDSDIRLRVGEISRQEPAPDPQSDLPEEPKAPKARPDYESPAFHREVREAYHEILPRLPRVIRWTRKREQLLNGRIRERIAEGKGDAGTIDYWRRFFTTVAARPFLLGENDRGWTADLEWLLLPTNFTKVIEGKFIPRRGFGGNSHVH